MTSPPDRSLHILVLTDREWKHPQGGGTGTNLHGQVTRWLRWGHRVTIVASAFEGCEPYEREGALTVHRMGGRSTVFPRAIWSQWRGLVPEPDVVLEVVNGITFLTPLWLRTPCVPLVHHVHREHYAEELGLLGKVAAVFLETLPLRYLYRRSRFLTVSRATAGEMAAQHRIPPGRIQVEYNGVEIADFGRGERAAAPELVYLGRLKRYKHIEVVLDVLEAIPEAMLHVAGDGDHRAALEHEIASRALSGRVVMHGFVDEGRKRELLQRAWVNLTASSVEGWVLTVMEAAACGTPSVALRVGGLPESIVDGRTGLLADDAAGLARQTARLVRDDALRERLGAAAFERAREFTWDRTAAQTLAMLAEAAGTPATGPFGRPRRFTRAEPRALVERGSAR
ncbi:MAG: glycosyltransferase family 4 protein [Actinobacteria bacterium]|nr:glycosyltransferase family 4 protein [Actinomycetota bacterium]